LIFENRSVQLVSSAWRETSAMHLARRSHRPPRALDNPNCDRGFVEGGGLPRTIGAAGTDGNGTSGERLGLSAMGEGSLPRRSWCGGRTKTLPSWPRGFDPRCARVRLGRWKGNDFRGLTARRWCGLSCIPARQARLVRPSDGGASSFEFGPLVPCDALGTWFERLQHGAMDTEDKAKPAPSKMTNAYGKNQVSARWNIQFYPRQTDGIGPALLRRAAGGRRPVRPLHDRAGRFPRQCRGTVGSWRSRALPAMVFFSAWAKKVKA